MTRFLRSITPALVVAAAFALPLPVGAHTDSDLVAVPAGEKAVVRLKPTHGCGDSPTTEVAIRVPVAGATPVDVPGWTATATDDGANRTVVEWTGGSLPVDQTGAFPVEFTAPGNVGELLLFPAVQVCENGEELSWISGDPAADYPAPRLLVLAPGSAPATSIDEVAADAPGRSQIAEVVALPPAAEGSTTTSTVTSEPDQSSTAPADSLVPTTTPPGAAERDRDPVDDGGPSPGIIIGSAVVVAGAGAIGVAALRRRQRSSGEAS